MFTVQLTFVPAYSPCTECRPITCFPVTTICKSFISWWSYQQHRHGLFQPRVHVAVFISTQNFTFLQPADCKSITMTYPLIISVQSSISLNGHGAPHHTSSSSDQLSEKWWSNWHWWSNWPSWHFLRDPTVFLLITSSPVPTGPKVQLHKAFSSKIAANKVYSMGIPVTWPI